jgi:hypothetical protein
MNKEFHYQITHLIATRSGFPPADADIIAISSQYVDDNSMIFKIDKDKPTAYSNYISQTMNILKPKAKLFRNKPRANDALNSKLKTQNCGSPPNPSFDVQCWTFDVRRSSF